MFLTFICLNRTKKENIFLWKKWNFSFITQKKKNKTKQNKTKQTNKQTFFLEEQTFIIYRYFFFGKERGGVYFKLKYLFTIFFLIYAKKKKNGKSVW